MKVLIIEDEQPTALRLKKLLTDLDANIQVLDILDSVESSIIWLNENNHPDLIFQDIHLADGSGFEIYESVKVDAPVIFTTAYDQYAIEAFKINSIDYLLKPVSKDNLQKSLDKFRNLNRLSKGDLIDYSQLSEFINPQKYQKRFMVRYGQKIKVIETSNIAYFYTISGNTFFKTFENNEYPSDFSLDKLEGMLDPEKYFRINRQFIIHIHSIEEMYTYSKSRVKIELKPASEIETIASTERSGKFKKWLSGNL